MSRPRPLVVPPCAVFQTAAARLRFAGLAVALALAAVLALLPDSAAAAGLPMRVSDTRDLPDSNLGDGICRAGFSGDTGCTLRAAIQEANNSFGSDTIIIDPGVYELEIPTFADDLDSTGDFDIRGSLTILGSTDPNNPTVVDGGFPGGAAINNTSKGTITILRTKVVDNPGQMIFDPADAPEMVFDPRTGQWVQAVRDPFDKIPAPGVYEPTASAIANMGEFGGIGTIRILDSEVSRNWAETDGAGIANHGDGVLAVERSKTNDNTSPAAGAGIYYDGGVVTVTDHTEISGNLAHDGAGIYNDGSSSAIGLRPRFTITNETVIKDNEATAGAGGFYNGGEAHLKIADTTIHGDLAADAGAGFATEGRSSMEASRLTVTENETYDEGGGAYVGSERLVTIEDSEFDKNKAGVPEPEDGFPRGTPPPDLEAVNIAGGGGLYTENGPVEMDNLTFTGNNASDEGGALSIDNHGDVRLEDSHFEGNHAGTDGGAIENSGFRVTFQRLKILRNRAEVDGGGIYNSSSNPFLLLDTHVEGNSAVDGGGLANAPDNDLVVRGSLFLRNVARHPGISEDGDQEEGGHGGAIFSLADGDSMVENKTLSGNSAATAGGGVVAESDFVPEVPPKANVAVIVRNSIVGGSRNGGSCDWYVTSHGGNMDTGGAQDPDPVEGQSLPRQTRCFLNAIGDSDSGTAPRRDRFSKHFTIDAIADNGGPTMTHRLNYGSLAIDAAVTPCPETDQRGVTRPQNGRCDMGAFEFEGPPPPEDDVPPDTVYLTGPIQDTPETVQYRFTGSDNQTATEDLNYECRVLEIDLVEEPEILAPWDPVPPELQWVGCHSPYQGLLIEEGIFRFEVRAVDRADNTDPTPAFYDIPPQEEPPDTLIVEKPPLLSNSRVATFTFSGVDAQTPPQFMEYECRIDSRDPDLWLECLNPTIFSNLTSGDHMIEVRAINGAELTDPTPARYRWTVGQLPNCDQANITLTAVADGWVDQVNPLNNYLFETELSVASGSTGDPTAVPPEPVLGQNARALYRFALPTGANGCALESARLRLFNEGPEPGRTVEVKRLAGPWKESTLTWSNKPGTMGTAIPSPVLQSEGYQEWNVLSHVQGMLSSGVNHGWQLSDAHENDPEGGEQTYVSREMPQDPPPATLPQLVLRYAAAPGPPPPAPVPASTETEVTCGQVIRQSIKVANDLHGCPGEGLVVGAPNIVVDLNGHTIHPPAVFVDPGEEDGLLAGVRNSGYTNVVIRNGTVKGYGYGVLLTGGTTRTVIEDMTLEGNLLGGIELNDADDGRNGNTIQDNLLTSNGESAISLINGSENSVIRRNKLDGNGGVGFQLIEADGHRFENNEMSGVPLNPLIDSDSGANLEHSSDNIFRNNSFTDFGDAGLVVTLASHRNLIEGNTIVRAGDAGVYIQDSDGNRVIGNTAHQSSDGGVVITQGNNTLVRGNDVRFNPNGVDTSNSNDVLIEDNDGSDSLQSAFEIGNGVNLVVRNNTANSSGGAGISLEGGAFDANGSPLGGALIEGNTPKENAETGITVADGGHTVRDNNAHNNAGYGISIGENPELPHEPFTHTNINGGENKAGGNAP